MIGGMERLRGSRAVNWRTILGLVLVPITAAGVLLWGLWSPTERLENVTAAVVNLDEPVEVDGQTVPLGRVLAAELIAGDADTNFTWVLTDESDGETGLDDGRYASVVTIPENFSAAATSTSERATIDIQTSDRGRLLDSALSNIVISTAMAVLNEQLGSQFVGNIFVGMTELGSGITEAADGAQQLADGSVQLADGGTDLADGAQQLSTGVQQFADGTAQLSSGAQGLVGGASDLASGAAGLAGGARQAAAGGQQLADGVGQYTSMVNLIVGGVIDSSADAIEPLESVRDLIAAIPPELWPTDSDMSQADTLAMLQGLIDEFTAASSGSSESQLVQLHQAGEDLASGSAASAAGQAALATGLEQYAAGVSEFSQGVDSYADGMAQVVPGAAQLASGTADLASGTVQLADGMRQAADGTAELADGLSLAASEIPSYSDAEIEEMSEALVRPVETTGANDELFSAAGVPLFAGIALWAGAFASFLLLAPLWRRTRDAARGVGYLTARSIVPSLAVGSMQGAIAGVVLPLLLGYNFSEGFDFFVLALLAGISFSLVNQGLSALLGGFGRFISFALLVVAFAIGVISTAPPLLQTIGDASPIGTLFAGFQAVAMGASGVGTAAFALIVWGLGGLAFVAFAVARERRKVAA